MKYARTVIAALLAAAAVLGARQAIIHAQHEQPVTSSAGSAPGRGTPAQESPVAQEAEQGREAHGDGWMAVIAKGFNFAILAGVLVYFLRTPLVEYLNGRIVRVREDLVSAAQMRETATKRLAEIHAQLAALPAEIAALKVRGTEEIAAERVRIDEAAQAERQKVLDHMRREIDSRLRIARRDLIEHAATLATEIASARIRAAITPEDQARLLDRYTSQVTRPEHGRGDQGARS